MTQVGPGQFEAEFDAAEAGSYVVSLRYADPADPTRLLTLDTGVSVAFSPEYRELRTNEALLSELADRTGGRVLESRTRDDWLTEVAQASGVSLDRLRVETGLAEKVGAEAGVPGLRAEGAGTVFNLEGLTPAERRSTIWEDLIRLTLLLFLLDVAIRRIAVNPVAIARKLRGFIGELAGRRPEAKAEAVLTSLKGTRERVREEMSPGAREQSGAKYEGPTADARATEELSKALRRRVRTGGSGGCTSDT